MILLHCLPHACYSSDSVDWRRCDPVISGHTCAIGKCVGVGRAVNPAVPLEMPTTTTAFSCFSLAAIVGRGMLREFRVIIRTLPGLYSPAFSISASTSFMLPSVSSSRPESVVSSARSLQGVLVLMRPWVGVFDVPATPCRARWEEGWIVSANECAQCRKGCAYNAGVKFHGQPDYGTRVFPSDVSWNTNKIESLEAEDGNDASASSRARN